MYLWITINLLVWLWFLIVLLYRQQSILPVFSLVQSVTLPWQYRFPNLFLAFRFVQKIFDPESLCRFGKLGKNVVRVIIGLLDYFSKKTECPPPSFQTTWYEYNNIISTINAIVQYQVTITRGLYIYLAEKC